MTVPILQGGLQDTNLGPGLSHLDVQRLDLCHEAPDVRRQGGKLGPSLGIPREVRLQDVLRQVGNNLWVLRPVLSFEILEDAELL